MSALRVGLLLADNFSREIIAAQLAPHAIDDLAGGRDLAPAALAERCRACDALVTGRSSPALPDALIGERGRLRLLAHCFGSVKHLITKAHIEAGIQVTNWGAETVAGVAESALALLLNGLKQVQALDAFIRADWRDDRRIYQDFPATLRGRDVGLYGYGPIGRHMGRFLEAFGAKVAIYDPYARDVPESIRRCASLRELFATCQCISVHCGLNDGTRGTVTRELLMLLPQGGVFVNTARGPIVVEADLVEVLASGRIVAALDVIENERRWAQSDLAKLPSDRVILTGHIIGNGKGPAPGTVLPPKGLPDFVVANVHALAAGEALRHVITADVYDLKT